MKTYTNIRLTLLALLTVLFALGACSVVMGQNTNHMQVNCDITVNKHKLKNNENVLVTIIDNSLNSKEILVSNKLLYNLEYNREYTILFEYKGCQAKSIYFNNYTNATDILLTCYFNINLKYSDSDDILHIADVYYDKDNKEFAYKITENFIIE